MSIWLSATPAMPATPEPSPNVMASTQGVRMPMEAAIRRFCVTARTLSPRLVRFSRSRSARKTPSANSTMAMRFHVSVTPATPIEPCSQSGVETSRFVGPKAVRTACCRMRLTPQVASSVSSGRP